jgi:phosphoglycerate dehydrogenase-like enzyme
MTLSIAVLDVLPEARVAELRALLPAGFRLAAGTVPGDDAMKAMIREADFAITGQVPVSADVLKAATRLRLLHKWGVGVDNIDVPAARALGIRVARTTGSNALSVAEFALGLMIATMRFSAHGHHKLKQGEWHGPGRLPGQTFLLSGKTVGIVGLGAIGTQLVKLLSGFGCTILYAKRTRLGEAEEQALGVRHAELDEMLASSDVLSLHCPLTPETEGLINARALARMKPTSVLVNVARGGVVNEMELYQALKDGVIRGAAMDVFSIEPVPADHPLLTLDNIVVTPHLAAVTADTFAPTVRRMFANIAAVARGEPVPELDRVA